VVKSDASRPRRATVLLLIALAAAIAIVLLWPETPVSRGRRGGRPPAADPPAVEPQSRPRAGKTPEAAAAILGTVVDEQGVPVEGALVRALGPSGPTAPFEVALDARREASGSEAETDVAGRFSLGCEDERPLDLQVLANGYATAVAHDVAPGSSPTIVVRGGVRLDVHVTAASGAPAVGVDLELWISRGSLRAARATTDATGSAVLHGAARSDLVTVVALPPDGAPHFESVRTALESRQDVVMRLPESVWVTGHVVEAGGSSPIEGATLGVWIAQIHAVRTDAEGAFRLALPPGDSYICVTAPGRARMCFRAERTSDVVVALMPETTLRGRAVDASGGGVPDVAVTVADETQSIEAGGPSVASGRTDADGRFRLSGLRGGSVHTLSVGARGYAPLRIQLPIPLAEERRDIDVGEVTLIATSTRLEVTVRDEVGAPAGGARIELRSLSAASTAGVAAWSWTAETDAAGEAEFRDLPVGTFELSAAPGTGVQTRRRVTVASGTNRVTVSVETARRLVVRIVDEIETPVRNAMVIVERADDGLVAFSGLTDAAGQIGILAGRRAYVVTAHATVASDPAFSGAVSAAAGADVDVVTLRCSRAAWLRGRLVAADGTPLVGREVVVRCEKDEDVSRVVTRHGGKFALPVAPDGTFTIEYWPGGTPGSQLGPAAVLTGAKPSDTEYEVRLP